MLADSWSTDWKYFRRHKELSCRRQLELTSIDFALLWSNYCDTFGLRQLLLPPGLIAGHHWGLNGLDNSLWVIRCIIETHEHTLKSDCWFITHRSLDNLNHHGNIPPVWASVGLAVQDSNESFGSATSSPLFLCSFMKWRNVFSFLKSSCMSWKRKEHEI